jgi:ubiquinone/menaquinone biosynthesis C-methylase UbiE
MWFDGQAEQFDEVAGLPIEAGRDIARAIREMSGCGRDDVLLDVGTGTGAIGLHFTEFPLRYLGMDLSQSMLEVFRRKVRSLPGHFLLLQANSDHFWPVRDDALAVVFASRVVHHLSIPHFLGEVWRVCRSGGHLLLGRVTRAAQSLPNRLQRHKRTILAEYGLHAGGGGQAIQQIVAECRQRGATPLTPVSGARWIRTTTARQLLSAWEAKPQLTSGSQGPSLSPENRAAIVKSLTAWARQEFGDLDRPEEVEEEYLLQGIRLP